LDVLKGAKWTTTYLKRAIGSRSFALIINLRQMGKYQLWRHAQSKNFTHMLAFRFGEQRPTESTSSTFKNIFRPKEDAFTISLAFHSKLHALATSWLSFVTLYMAISTLQPFSEQVARKDPALLTVAHPPNERRPTMPALEPDLTKPALVILAEEQLSPRKPSHCSNEAIDGEDEAINGEVPDEMRCLFATETSPRGATSLA
jgi:hypothetical protein